MQTGLIDRPLGAQGKAGTHFAAHAENEQIAFQSRDSLAIRGRGPRERFFQLFYVRNQVRLPTPGYLADSRSRCKGEYESADHGYLLARLPRIWVVVKNREGTINLLEQNHAG